MSQSTPSFALVEHNKGEQVETPYELCDFLLSVFLLHCALAYFLSVEVIGVGFGQRSRHEYSCPSIQR